MGIKACCGSPDEYNLEKAYDQKSFTEALSKEITRLHENLNQKNFQGREILKEHDKVTCKTKASDNLKLMVNDLGDNFYIITLICYIEDIEKRFRKETYKEFPKVKNRFLEYYNLAIKNYDFYLLVDETKKFNAFLDKNI